VKAAVEAGYAVSIACRALGYSRSSYYACRAASGIPKRATVDEVLAAQIKVIIKENPEFGYRRIWAHLNKRLGISVGRNRVHRIVKLKGWQATAIKRPGQSKQQPTERKRHQVANPKERIVTSEPNTRWATDATKVYVEEAGWMNLIPVIDCCSSRILSYVFAKRGRALEAVSALEDAVKARFGSLEPVAAKLALRTDNGSIFLAKSFLASISHFGIAQEFTPYHCPSANGVIERWNKTFKEECAWCYSFKTVEEAERVIADWIRKYNHERMHSRLDYQSPVEFENVLQKNAA
jgi:transposase InsO family protein